MNEFKVLEIPKDRQIINLPFYQEIDKKIANGEKFAYFLKGVVGSGKTELLKILAKAMKKKIWVMPDLWNDYYQILCSDYTDKNQGMERRIKAFQSDVIILDDFGAESEIHNNATKFTISCIFEMYAAWQRKQFYQYIFTGNIPDYQKLYGDRVYDRLIEIFTIVKFPDKSFREASQKIIDLESYKGEDEDNH